MSDPIQQPDPQEVMRAFLESIIDGAHDAGMTAELREQMIADLGDRLNDRLILTVLANLTEPEQEAFEVIASDPARVSEIEEFLRGKIPRYDELMATTMDRFREDYLTGAGEDDAA